MKTLVIIPALMHKYSFSAPLAWLFAKDADKVQGVYSAALTPELVRSFSRFIVELNWFIELYEFGLIVRFIKRHNQNAEILFGGLYSQLKYHEIFRDHPVDYFIIGDAELPIREFLAGTDPRRIPNMIGREFRNRHTYRFSSQEFRELEFDTDWLSGFDAGWNSYPEPDNDEDMRFDQLPRYPEYSEADSTVPLAYRWRIPPRGGRYHLPMLITGRGGCPAAHRGCEYCMGSRSAVLREIYGRPPLVMDNDTLIGLLKKVDQKFERVSLYINSDCNYDLREHHFDLEATIEIDSRGSAADLARILPAFRKARAHVALFEEGITGKATRCSVEDYLSLADQDHRVYFFANPADLANFGIPSELRLYTEFVFPYWTHWDYYTDPRKALSKSRQWYIATGQMNLYTAPERRVRRTIRSIVMYTLWRLNRAGIYDPKRLLL